MRGQENRGKEAARDTETREAARDTEREASAQSEVIGIVLLLGITLASIGILFLLAQPIVSDTTDRATIDKVENEILTLDSRLTAASLDTSRDETLSFSLEGGQLFSEPNTTTVTVTLDGNEVYEANVGKIEYTLSSESVAYEAGGVWRRDALQDGSSMVSSPEFDFDGETLTLPIYNVTTEGGYSGSRTVDVLGGERERFYPVDDGDNPVNGQVNVTVESDYYEAWARYFEEELRAEVTLGDNSVEAELLAFDAPDEITTAGASKKEYDAPSNDPFESIEDGVRFPSVDRLIGSYVEYGRENEGSAEVGDVAGCETECGGSNEPQVFYNATDYTLENGQFDTSGGNITVVVDGDLTVESAEITNGNNNVTIVTTGDLKFADDVGEYTVGADDEPERLVFHAPSDSEVSIVGDGTGEGVIYAPDALVTLGDMEGEWEGSIVGKVIDASGVSASAEVNFGGDVSVQQTEFLRNLYVTERNVGID